VGRLGLGLAVILILIVVGMYPRVCPRRAHDVAARGKAAAYAAKPQATRRPCEPRGEAADLRARGKAARGKAASCRGKAARYNLVKYYLAFAFKLFYYEFFDL